MGMLCNFGENELPQKPPCDIDLKAETQAEFDWRVRYMESRLKDMAEWDPSFRRKVDILSENHSPEELKRALSDLEWEQVGAERKCRDGHQSPEDMSRLETLMTRIAALRCAIEQKETEDERN